MVDVLAFGIVVNEFELQLRYYVKTTGWCKSELFEIELFDHLTMCKQMTEV